MDELTLNQLANNFCEFSEKLGFSNPIIRSDTYISEIYVLNKHALQIEIDWRENELFMYVVYIRDNMLPNKNVIYNYDDGHWCRKFIEEIYKVKHPQVNKRQDRYSSEYLFNILQFYKKLIGDSPEILVDFLKGNTDADIVDNS
ncbi:MAG: hypothetical protein J6S00_04905 [Clostridia bacterium]|nr:hypothetical protein [Clostridia bacterium]